MDSKTNLIFLLLIFNLATLFIIIRFPKINIIIPAIIISIVILTYNKPKRFLTAAIATSVLIVCIMIHDMNTDNPDLKLCHIPFYHDTVENFSSKLKKFKNREKFSDSLDPLLKNSSRKKKKEKEAFNNLDLTTENISKLTNLNIRKGKTNEDYQKYYDSFKPILKRKSKSTFESLGKGYKILTKFTEIF
tara:strand:- start:37 stop:606 length:570 start_codon:yes stop_codon:yes gene_type:complete